MKATGIVRRIDDLGRVVIPKEIRRTMRIREGDPLEIYTNKDGEVIFKKYSPIGELSPFAVQFCETLSKTSGQIAAVTDRDTVIAVAGAPRFDLMDKRVSTDLEHIMEQRKPFHYTQGGVKIIAVEGQSKYQVSVAAPIVAEGDVSGCVVFLAPESAPPAGDTELKLVQTVAGFLGKQMES